MTATPLQMAAAIGGMAIGGVWNQPHLVREGARLIPARHGELNQENIRKVISGMYGVVNQGLRPDPIAMEWSNYLFANGGEYHDDNWKSTEELVRKLIDSASKGGNYLLNVGRPPRD